MAGTVTLLVNRALSKTFKPLIAIGGQNRLSKVTPTAAINMCVGGAKHVALATATTQTKEDTDFTSRVVMTSLFQYHVGEDDDQLSSLISFDDYMRQCWDRAMTCGNVFRYSLEGTTTRLIEEGQYRFIVQNNPKRLTHKRVPVENRKLIEPFSHENFHFNKISNEEEILCTIQRKSKESAEQHLAIANVSPIEYCHFLLVPYPKHCLPQVITETSLMICLELFSLSQRRDLYIVANSLLAYASVNHLHYHFLCLDYPLLVKRVDGEYLNKGCYHLKGHPMNGFGFQCTRGRGRGLRQIASNVYRVVKILLEQDIPHNLLILRRTSFEDSSVDNVITVILMPRKPAYGVKTLYDEKKDLPPFFVAACEIGGFIPIIDQSKYAIIKENEILQQMRDKSLTKDEFQSLKSSLVKYDL